RFVILGLAEVGFAAGPYDASQPLVIDPVLSYGTYIGGSGADQAYAVAVDSSGAAYVTGETSSFDFPKTFPISSSTGSPNAFLIKLNPSGTAVVYAAYFGGQGRSSARGVAVDSAGNAYVTGFSYAPDFPTSSGAYRTPVLGQVNAFVI